MSDTEKDFTAPASVERSITSTLVLKKRNAIIETAAQPTIPVISAGCFQIRSIASITRIGKTDQNKDTDIICTILPNYLTTWRFNFTVKYYILEKDTIQSFSSI